MTSQPISDRINDLRQWLTSPTTLRDDSSGAVRVLDEIAGSHADLLAALKYLADNTTNPALVAVADAALAKVEGRP